jgi:hypothetical protein
MAHHQKVISNDQFWHMDTTILQSSYEKIIILANDLVVCAQYFDHIMNIVINILMRWDKKLQCPTPSGGLFGFCKRFASTKSQRLGNLNAHWLVYTHGMPTTTIRFLQLVN